MAEDLQGSMTSTQEGEVTEKTYTESEVQALLQAESDRRVTSALSKQKKEFEKKQAEAEKLKAMDESQRKEYEYEQRLLQLEQKEKEFNLAQNKLEATKVLANRELPIEFVDYLVAEDAETMMENITTFETAFKAAVQDAVAKRISQSSPKVGAVKQTGLDKEGFKKMSFTERTRLYQTNPELYERLKNN